MVTYLGLLVQLCCGEAGTLQTNITGEFAECSQCIDHTGFAPAHVGMCFPGLHCSAGVLSNCPKWALHLVHFPGLSCSVSGSWLFHKSTDSVGIAFCALPRSEQLRQPGTWRVPYLRCAVPLNHLPRPVARFSRSSMRAPSQLCLLWGADLML